MKAVVTALLILCCGGARAADIVIHSVLFEPIGNAIMRAFNEAHRSKNLQIKIVRGQTGAMTALYDQELRAGRVSTDLMFLGDPGMFLKLAREDKLTPYCSASFKDYRPEALSKEVFVDWITTLEGQKSVNRLGHFSLRKDFTSVEGDDLSKIKYHWWNAEELDKHREQWTQEALKILSGN